MTLLFLLVGLGAGVLSGLFGIGGGTVIVPALVFFAGFSIKTATGTSLGALLLPVGVLGAVVYYREQHLDIRAALLLAVGLLLGALVGAKLNAALSATLVRRLFAVFLAAVAVRMWIKG